VTDTRSGALSNTETRYQWIINVLLVIVGFFSGIVFEAERMKAQVVTNTVEIRLMSDTLSDIQEKLNLLISERQTEFQHAM
jgi:Ni,Fe-hydrogenase III component G